MEKIDKVIEILQAFKGGKELEYYMNAPQSENYNQWVTYTAGENDLIYYLSHFKMRIKPEPKYRPYTSIEEFLNNSKIHGPYVIYDKNVYRFPDKIYHHGIEVTSIEHGYHTWEKLLKNLKWQDGTPCGVLIHQDGYSVGAIEE